MASLADGTLTATASYAVDGSPLTGQNLTILKDTVRPSNVHASLPSGIYREVQSVTLSTNEASAAIYYSFDEGNMPDASSTRYTGPLTILDAAMINAVAVDAAGNQSIGVSHFRYTIDSVPPAVTIGATPNDPTNSRTANFGFEASEGATFECSLAFGSAADSFSSCSSPATLSLIRGDGTYTFKVRATDAAGNVGVASYSFELDTTVAAPSVPDPDAASDSGRSSSDNLTNDSTPSFSGTAEAGATVTILVDGVAQGSGVATGGVYTITTDALAGGTHSVTAQAVDRADNTSPVSAPRSIMLDLAALAVTLLQSPNQPKVNDTVAFRFSVPDEQGLVVECSLSSTSDDFAPRRSSVSYGPLSIGFYTFKVHAADAAGNTGTALYSFGVGMYKAWMPLVAR